MIHIVDTCLNFLQRYVIARRLLHHVDDNKILSKEQWGGRPRLTAIDLVMSKEMMITMLHLLRQNGAITDVDATACYNRIAVSLQWLSYAKAGATQNIIQLLAKALENLQYFIATSFGLSTKKNQHSKEDQFHGPRQGATDGPFCWAILSMMIIYA